MRNVCLQTYGNNRILNYFDKKLTVYFQPTFTFLKWDSSTRVGCERCSRLISKTLARRNSIAAVHLLGLNNFYTLFECFYDRFLESKEMSSVVLAVFQCWCPHTFIMQPTTPLQRTDSKATSKNLKFSFLENNSVQ